MRKIWKLVLTVSGFLAVLGILLLVTGLILGGHSALKELLSTAKGEAQADSYHTICDGADVKNLRISGAACVLYIREHDGNSFIIEGAERAGLTYKAEGGSIELTEMPERSLLRIFSDDEAVATLFVPRSAKLAETSIRFAAGSLDVENLRSARLKIDMQAGGMKASGIDADATTVNASAANASIQLNGREKDYNYGISGEACEIRIGDTAYNGMDLMTGRTIDNKGSKTASIKASAGSVAVTFEE